MYTVYEIEFLRQFTIYATWREKKHWFGVIGRKDQTKCYYLCNYLFLDQQNPAVSGYITSKVLTVLDILDRHCFDRVDSTTSLDILYNNIFAVIHSKEGNEVSLTTWPVSSQVMHRTLIIIVMAVISIVLHLTGKNRHTTLYKIKKKMH